MTNVHHIGIAVDDIEKYIKIFEDMGGKVIFKGVAEEFEAECVFVDMGNIYIELIKGTKPNNHISRFIRKRGDGALHHICFNGNVKNGKNGALPNMLVSFDSLKDTGGILIEHVIFK